MLRYTHIACLVPYCYSEKCGLQIEPYLVQGIRDPLVIFPHEPQGFFFRLLYFYPQSIWDYQYMYDIVSTNIVYRNLT
jgi:hypothetical protein